MTMSQHRTAWAAPDTTPDGLMSCAVWADGTADCLYTDGTVIAFGRHLDGFTILTPAAASTEPHPVPRRQGAVPLMSLQPDDSATTQQMDASNIAAASTPIQGLDQSDLGTTNQGGAHGVGSHSAGANHSHHRHGPHAASVSSSGLRSDVAPTKERFFTAMCLSRDTAKVTRALALLNSVQPRPKLVREMLRPADVKFWTEAAPIDRAVLSGDIDPSWVVDSRQDREGETDLPATSSVHGESPPRRTCSTQGSGATGEKVDESCVRYLDDGRVVVTDVTGRVSLTLSANGERFAVTYPAPVIGKDGSRVAFVRPGQAPQTQPQQSQTQHQSLSQQNNSTNLASGQHPTLHHNLFDPAVVSNPFLSMAPSVKATPYVDLQQTFFVANCLSAAEENARSNAAGSDRGALNGAYVASARAGAKVARIETKAGSAAEFWRPLAAWAPMLSIALHARRWREIKTAYLADLREYQHHHQKQRQNQSGHDGNAVVEVGQVRAPERPQPPAPESLRCVVALPETLVPMDGVGHEPSVDGRSDAVVAAHAAHFPALEPEDAVQLFAAKRFLHNARCCDRIHPGATPAVLRWVHGEWLACCAPHDPGVWRAQVVADGATVAICPAPGAGSADPHAAGLAPVRSFIVECCGHAATDAQKSAACAAAAASHQPSPDRHADHHARNVTDDHQGSQSEASTSAAVAVVKHFAFDADRSIPVPLPPEGPDRSRGRYLPDLLDVMASLAASNARRAATGRVFGTRSPQSILGGSGAGARHDASSLLLRSAYHEDASVSNAAVATPLGGMSGSRMTGSGAHGLVPSSLSGVEGRIGHNAAHGGATGPLVHLSSTVPGVGVFTAYTDGRVRVVFDDRTVLTLAPGPAAGLQLGVGMTSARGMTASSEYGGGNNPQEVYDVGSDQDLVCTAVDAQAVRSVVRVATVRPCHALYPYLLHAVPFRRFAFLPEREQAALAQADGPMLTLSDASIAARELTQQRTPMVPRRTQEVAQSEDSAPLAPLGVHAFSPSIGAHASMPSALPPRDPNSAAPRSDGRCAPPSAGGGGATECSGPPRSPAAVGCAAAANSLDVLLYRTRQALQRSEASAARTEALLR